MDKMRFNAYKSGDWTCWKARQNNCWSSCWWSAKNIDYRDNSEKHFHSAPNKRRFCFHLRFRSSRLSSPCLPPDFCIYKFNKEYEKTMNTRKIKNNSTLPREIGYLTQRLRFFFLSLLLLMQNEDKSRF